MRRKCGRWCAVVAALGVVAGTESADAQQKRKQEVTNGTATINVNDLTVRFNGTADDVRYTRMDGSTVGPSMTSTSMGQTTATWNTNDMNDNVPAGETRSVAWESNPDAGGATRVDKANSFWTQDGAMVVDSLTSIGTTPDIFGDPATGLFAQFHNPEMFQISYGNIRAFVGNNLAAFTVEQFDLPTGELVGGLPSLIMLNPGESVMLSLGTASLGTYQLVRADAFAAGVAGEFSFATGAIPAPGAAAMLGAAVAVMMLRRRR